MTLIDPTLTDSQRTKTGVHSLQRTNVRLSGNIKYVYDNDFMYLESINSTMYLSSSQFKANKINKSVSLPLAVKNFMQGSSELTEWYTHKNVNLEQAKYPYEQRDYLYEWGAYYDSSSPLQKNRFFAPLFTYGELPEMFCIFRLENESYANDIKKILTKGKLIKAVDMRKGHNSYFDWIRTYLSDRNFRPDSLQVNYSGDDKSISYYGFSAENGNWASKREFVLNDYLANERMILETNNDITNGYSRNSLIHPALFNFEFTFEDLEVANGWSQYVGFYCNLDDITTGEAENVLLQNPEALFISKHKNEFERTIEQADPYLQVSNKLTAFKSEELASQAELNWLWIPPKNSVLQIRFNSIIVYEFKFDSYNTIKQAKQALLRDFRSAKLNSVSLRMFEDGDRFFIASVNTSEQYENLELVLPSSIRTTYGFKVVNSHDLIVTGFPQEDIISLNNDLYLIEERYMYRDFFVIRLDKEINLSTTTNLELMSYVYPELFLCSYIPHKDFDYSIDRSSNYDPVDSDPVLNKKYLIDSINDPLFVGGWDQDSGISLAQYKANLIDMVNEHFDSINIPKEFMLKDLDIVTLEAQSTVPNEYLRLEESTNAITKDVNKFNPFIVKWGHSQGRNVYSRPYDLNIALSMRYDNFAPEYSNAGRDLRTHTHSWYVIGEGLPPYFTNARKALGYTNKPIEYTDLIDTDIDAYEEYLTHLVDGYHETSWSEMKLRDGSQTNYYTFFRGAELEFTGNYEGYRFCAILLTKDQVSTTSVSDYISIVDNKQFKTLTILIRFYIPDPVLTSLEGGIPYMLDRSLLYFSNKVYSTKKLSSFGQDVISLDLYNEINRKYFNGVDVGYDWRHHDVPSNTTYYNIRRGDIFRWNGDFLDVLSQGDDFTWRTVRNDGTTIVEYKAVNVIEIQSEYFWCEDIQMRSFREPTGQQWRSLKSELASYTGEPTLLTKDNDWYISKAISYYNSIYDIVVSPRTNNKRYKAVSFAAIANILNNYAINYTYVTESDITVSEKRIKVYEPSYFPILNSIKSEDNRLLQLEDTQLIFPMYRYSGTYSPIFRTIYNGSMLYNSSKHGTIEKINKDLRYIKKWSTISMTDQIDIEDRNYTLSPIYDSTLKLYNNDNFSIMNRYTNVNKSNSFISSIFRYFDTIEIISTERIFDLRNLTREVLLSTVFGASYANNTISNQMKLDVLKTYVHNATMNSMQLEDVDNYTYTNFFLGTFISMYSIDRILTIDDKIIQYSQKNTFEYEMEADYGRIILKLS
ncbi:gp265 [Sphingomonas phage PAU]|uniref:gp265 n=1 Tax=Sphingomonas phage PAU TaxID=1150991 RepID=UPI000257340F|nr:gp265 [Sphingomonas phage PAU]AFF28263.1 gp265 [Sphingomonas phage PAU]